MSVLPASVLGALLLGVIQGLTEFLPVSSSGHLVLFGQFLEAAGDDVAFDIALHLGTLVPVLIFYRDTIVDILRSPFAGEGPLLEREGVRLAALVVGASVPTAIIGLLFEDLFESLFANPASLTVSFAITAVVLWVSGRQPPGTRKVADLGVKDALLVGLAQGIAITPGISRSGSTIAAALLLGIDRELAARYSFLLSIPAIGGAAVLKLRHFDGAGLDPVQTLVGAGSALVVGYFALTLLVQLVKQGRLAWFAGYCGLMAVVAGAIALSGA